MKPLIEVANLWKEEQEYIFLRIAFVNDESSFGITFTLFNFGLGIGVLK